MVVTVNAQQPLLFIAIKILNSIQVEKNKITNLSLNIITKNLMFITTEDQ